MKPSVDIIPEKWFGRVLEAEQNLKGQAHLTPIMTSRTLNQDVGADVFLKCENFQRIGAFKFRGAYHAVSRLSATQRKAGVITFSSGNHAQAVALVGRLLEVPATVVMPDDAPLTKRAATEGYGATVVGYDPAVTTREALARRMAEEQGLTLIPPFDHPDVIAGQGTSALEMFRTLGSVDMLLVPCGGGGLLSGCAAAAVGLAPSCRVIGIEPELGDDATRSFYSGTLQTVSHSRTIADGTRTPSLGSLTFPLIRTLVSDMATVSEEAIREAVRFLFYRMKLVVEPSGALGIAALRSGSVRAFGRVGVIVSGGNMDGPTTCAILGEAE